MIEQGLFKRHFVGRDGFYWWIGQIAPEATWKNNLPGIPSPTNESQRGFSERYRVRIMNHHTANPDELPDEVLPWAHVMYPPTAGSGNRDSSQSANLAQGDFVFGFFLDGEDAQQPIIMGCLGNNDYQAVMANVPPTRFIPFTGYQPGESRSTSGVKKVLDPGLIGQNEYSIKNQSDIINTFAHESVNSTTTISSLADDAARRIGELSSPLPKTEECEKLPLGKIQKEIQRIIQLIENVQKSLSDVRYSLTGLQGQAEAKINYYINEASRIISGGLKWVFTQVEKYVLKNVNDLLKNTYFLLFPNQRSLLKVGVETANDAIACAFKKLIGGLFGMVSGFISSSIGKAINIGSSFVGGFLGQILGQIGGVLKGIIGSVLGPISSLIGQAIDFGGSILGLITDVLSFLLCEERPACTTIDEWSAWLGGNKSPKYNFDSIINQANTIASTFNNVVDGVETTIDNFEFKVDFESAYNTSISIATDQANQVINDTIDNVTNVVNFPVTQTVSRAFAGGTPSQATSNLATTSETLPNQNQTSTTVENPSSTQPITKPATVIPTVQPSTNPTGARAAGPPTASFIDSEGTGASGNLIISPSGEIIGYDVISTGVNYTAFTLGYPEDDCGKGRGGVITPILGSVKVTKNSDSDYWVDENGFSIVDSDGLPITVRDQDGNVITDQGETKGIVGILVEESGTDYLSQPDGSFGGDGRTWSNPEDTILENVDKTLEPIPPGRIVDLIPDDIITLPPGTLEVTEPAGEEIRGGTPYLVKEPGTITTPSVTYEKGESPYPISSNGSYPVILNLDEIFVKESGAGYNENDEIVIEPDNGAKAVPVLGEVGQVVSVKVTEPGEGFTERPTIYVRSQTGFNSILIPKLGIDRIGQDQLKEPSEVERLQGKLISVIDCVGKV